MIQLKSSFIVLLLSVTYRYVFGTSLQWRSNKEFDGKLPNSTIPTINSSNLIHCSRLCSEDDTCYSFFHIKDTHWNCMLLDVIIKINDGLTYTSGASYYTSNGAKPSATAAATTTTTTTATPVTSTISTAMSTLLSSVSAQSSTTSFPCPDIYEYNTVTLADSSTLIYKVGSVLDNFHAATTACDIDGGFLARITSVAKLEYLDAVLTNCQPFFSNYIRIDGYNGIDTSEWVYSNGDIAPMDANLLSDGYPLIPNERHCLVMNLNDKVQDYNCADTAETYVCEKE